jgi:hypothetical protein
MEKSTSWEANYRSACQDIPFFMDPRSLLDFLQEPASGPYSEPSEFSLHPLILFIEVPF